MSVNVGAGPGGSGALAEAEADASGVRLFGGRVVVNALHVGIRSDAGVQGTEAGVVAWSADITVDGQDITEQPGTPVDIAGIGTLTLMEQLVDGGTVTANALRVQITDPASGLAVGTDVVLGHVKATTGDPIPDSPSPDPGSAPSAPGAAGPADGADGSPSAGGRALPIAPAPSMTPVPGATSPLTPSSGLGLLESR